MTRSHGPQFRLFLDANVLVSAAWKLGSRLLALWQILNIELVTSDYVVDESRRNLPEQDQQNRLTLLLEQVRVARFSAVPILENAPAELPTKDQPVLAAAVLLRADFLVTGDSRHFGKWYGKEVFGIRVEPPRNFPEVLKSARGRRPAH